MLAGRSWRQLRGAPWLRPFRNAGVLLLGRTTQGVISLAYTVLAARALGVADFGALVLLHGFVVAVSEIARFKSWQVLLRYGARPLHHGDTPGFQRALGFSVLLDLIGAGIALAVVVLAIAPAAGLFGLSPEVQELARIYGLSIVFMASAGTSTGVLRLLDRFDLLAIQSAVAPTVRLIGVLLLYASDAGLEAFLAVWFLATVIARPALLLFAWRALKARRLLSRPGASLRGALHPERGAWRFALGTNLNGTLSLAEKHLGLLAVGWVLGPAAAGLFRVARQFADLLVTPTTKLMTPAVYPELARLTAQGDGHTRRHVVVRSALLVGCVSAAAFVVLALFGSQLIELTVGRAFSEASETMLLLALAGVFANFTFTLEPLLISIGHVRATVIVRSVATAVYLALLYPLLVTMDLLGAGIAAIVYAALASAMLVLLSFRTVRTSYE